MTFINPIYNTCNVYTPAFKAKGENSTAPVSNPIPQPNISFKGTEALAAYNYNLINKNKDFDSIPTIKPIEIPQNLEEIDGEKVYNSKGELVLVEKEIGNQKFLYHNDSEKLIEVYDKTSGKKVKEQSCFTNINNEKMITVTEFGEGKNHCHSGYVKDDNGIVLFDNMKFVEYPDGSQKEFIYNAQEKNYEVIERSPKGDFKNLYDRVIFYDENKRLKEIWENDKNGRREKKINYEKGIPYQIEEKNTKTIPNKGSIDTSFLNDSDLVPAKKFNFHPNAKDIDGEKTYYSNGAIETNTFVQDGKKVTYSYLANGELRNVFYDDVVIECNGEWGYAIYENIENGARRETTYHDNGSSYVSYTKDELEKGISYINGKVVDYHKSIDGKGTSYEFDQNGNIKDVMETEFIRD